MATDPRPELGAEESTTIELPVAGMTCAACEKRVRTELLRRPGVTKVDVSAARARARVSGAPLPSREVLKNAIRRAGYDPKPPSLVNGSPRAWLTVLMAAVLVGVLVWLLLGVDYSVGGLADDVEGLAVLAVIALVGLTAGVSTCMALVGGLVLAVSAQYVRAHPDASAGARVRPQLAFQSGRILGFTLLGAVLGALGSAFALPTAAVGILMIAVAVVMTLLGVRLTGLSPRLSAWGPSLPRKWSDSLAPSERTPGEQRTLWRAAGLGAATLILPCGITQSVEIFALATGSPAMSAAVMGVFALGTAPGLLALGGLGGFAPKSQVLAGVTGVLVIGLAVVTLIGGLRSVGIRIASHSTPTAVTENVTTNRGVQVVRMRQTSRGYIPAQSVVWAGMPTRWVIEAESPFSCTEALRAPALGVSTYLKHGQANVFEIPPLEPGVYAFDCVMGMYPGEIVAIERTPPS